MLIGLSLGLFAACGGDSDGGDDKGGASTVKSTTPASDKKEVSETVESFNTAIADGDGQAACDLATDQAQEKFTKSQDEPDCPTAVEKFSKLLATSAKDTLRNSKVTEVRFGAGRRTASARFTGGTVPRDLVKSGDGWLLANILNF